jgi:hypothetical protein
MANQNEPIMIYCGGLVSCNMLTPLHHPETVLPLDQVKKLEDIVIKIEPGPDMLKAAAKIDLEVMKHGTVHSKKQTDR